MGEGIHSSKDAYYDTGESSVFFLAVFFWMTEPDIDTLNRFLWQLVGKGRVRVFKWTDKNDYVALCESDYISFGRGCASRTCPSSRASSRHTDIIGCVGMATTGCG